MRITLKWVNRNENALGHRIYRDTKPINTGALPEPLATLSASADSWHDTDIVRNQKYFYVIGSYNSNDVVYTSNLEAIAVEDNGPGPQQLVAGDYNAGFFGVIDEYDLVTGPELKELTGHGLSAGTAKQQWAKVAHHGKILYVPLGYGFGHTTWENLYREGLLFGEDGPGPQAAITANDGIPVNQLVTFTKENRTYKVRTLRGLPDRPDHGYTGTLVNNATMLGDSEFNQVMGRLAYGSYGNHVNSDVAGVGVNSLTHGGYRYNATICPDMVNGKNVLRFFRWGIRYRNYYNNYRYMASTLPNCANTIAKNAGSFGSFRDTFYAMWRPVIELVLPEVGADLPPPGPGENPYGAGSTTIAIGDDRLGFVDRLTSEEFIDGTTLAQAINFTAGTPIAENNDTDWIKYSYNGKVRYVAQKPLRSNLSGDELTAAGLKTGAGNKVVIGDSTYIVTMMQGSALLASEYDGPGNDLRTTHNTEWNQVMYRLYDGTDLTASEEPYENWLRLSGEELDLRRHSFCNGSIYGRPVNTIVGRGMGQIGHIASLLDESKVDENAWRPVLELVDGIVTVPTLPSRTPDEYTIKINSVDGLSISGTVSGQDSIIVSDMDGFAIGEGTADNLGNFNIVLSAAIANGESAEVLITNVAGVVELPIVVVGGADTIAPVKPTALINDIGTTVTGVAEIGSTVSVKNAEGVVIGTVVVGDTGSYELVLDEAVTDNATATVTSTDAAGNVSEEEIVVGKLDTIAPGAPVVEINVMGTVITGNAEIGSTVKAVDIDNVDLGSVVATDGTFSITLARSMTDGELFHVTAKDTSGNVSAQTAVVGTLDTAIPVIEAASIDTVNGKTLTASVMAGATVTATDAEQVVLGSGVSGATNDVSFKLLRPVTDGEVITLTAVSIAGNEAVAVEVTGTLDTIAPTTPTAELNVEGTILAGSAEEGSTIDVEDSAKLSLGSAVVTGGAFSITLTRPAVDGEVLTVTAMDSAGNLSAPLSLTFSEAAVPPEVVPGPAGGDTITIGDAQLGMMDTVASSELVTGSALASLVGLTAGDAIIENDTTNWIKYAYDGKTRYVAQKPIRSNLSASELIAAGLTGEVDKVIDIDGQSYRVTLMEGANPTLTEYDGVGDDKATTHGSEWNRVMYRLYSGTDVTASEEPLTNWLELSNIELDTNYYCFTRGTVFGRPTNTTIARGFGSISHVASLLDESKVASNAWRPVLEVVEDIVE